MKRSEKIIIAVLLAVAVLCTVAAVTGCFTGIENGIAKVINPNAEKNLIFLILTRIGEVQGVVSVAAIFVLIPKTHKTIGGPTAVNTIISWLLNTGIKNIVKRSRPIKKLIKIGGYSFPSGHAMNNSALYISLMLFILPYLKKKWQKAVLVIFCVSLTLGIGFSRIYFNVHYTSDVIAGLCLGTAVALMGNIIYRKRKGAKNG